MFPATGQGDSRADIARGGATASIAIYRYKCPGVSKGGVRPGVDLARREKVGVVHSWGEKRGRLPLVDAGDRPFACRRRNQRGGTEGRRERSWKKKIWIGGAGKGIFFVDRTYQARWNNATMQIIEFFFFSSQAKGRRSTAAAQRPETKRAVAGK